MFQRSEENHDVVEFTAVSSSLLSKKEPPDTWNDHPTTAVLPLPVQLVRGQSMEVTLMKPLPHAFLCGKYISPLPQHSDQIHRALIGSTHEFSSIPLSKEQVITDLQSRTQDFAPFRYNNDTADPPLSNTTWSNNVISVDRITCGYRVQSTRSDYGRRPIIGKIPLHSNHHATTTTTTMNTTSNDWIFTGLSSRGLLYHGLYGQLLANAIRQNDESVLLETCPDILWWKS
jgi:glycine/D-amino acid oxidase-like deaminating enzyme